MLTKVEITQRQHHRTWVPNDMNEACLWEIFE